MLPASWSSSSTRVSEAGLLLLPPPAGWRSQDSAPGPNPCPAPPAPALTLSCCPPSSRPSALCPGLPASRSSSSISRQAGRTAAAMPAPPAAAVGQHAPCTNPCPSPSSHPFLLPTHQQALCTLLSAASKLEQQQHLGTGRQDCCCRASAAVRRRRSACPCTNPCPSFPAFAACPSSCCHCCRVIGGVLVLSAAAGAVGEWCC